jgi:hypothetical protein
MSSAIAQALRAARNGRSDLEYLLGAARGAELDNQLEALRVFNRIASINGG